MIELTCWGCGRPGLAPARFGLCLATCKRCRAVNLVPARSPRATYPLGRAQAVGRPKPIASA
jgi:hypothetical protein